VVEPISDIENSDMTRPRNFGSEWSCNVAFESAIVATLATPTNGMTV